MVPVIVVADGGAHLFPAQVTEPVVPVAPVVVPVGPAVGVPPGAVDGAVAAAKSFNPWTCRPTRPRTPQSLRARS